MTAEHGIVLFDGTCAFCTRAVIFIAARDPAGYFRFGASQSPEAIELLERFQTTREAARSIILIEGDRLSLRSTATLRIAARLSWPWSMARVCLCVPVPIRDAVYRGVATVRHRISRRSTVCAFAPPELRARMIPAKPPVSTRPEAPPSPR